MAEKVTTEDRGAVRILTINRPDQRNCVDGETAVDIGRATVVRPQCFSEEIQAGLRRFAGGARRLAASAGAVAELRTYGTEGNQRWKRRDGCSTTRR
jgi:hypothetical protein